MVNQGQEQERRMWTWALLPVFLAVGGIVGTWAVFAVSVSNNTVNVTAKFPFISECATNQPESALFCLFCIVWTVLIIWVVVIRYRQVRELGNLCRRANLAALVLGFTAASGVSILGSFPLTVSLGVHLFGAYLAFFVGLAYFWVQLWLTYKAEPSQDRRCVGPWRASLCSLCTLFLIGMFVLKPAGFRSLSAISEWAMVMVFFILFGSFAVEFRHVDHFQVTVQKQNVTKENSDDTLNRNLMI
ncbi:modulator of macroautophagy TMEM150B-like [Sardina pilchardus]|uniref:modulator of macroautophagy TMEM150B-like n=1 Tax=Sardina pilchardus TaxID=27697 RepID=UPI002E15A003